MTHFVRFYYQQTGGLRGTGLPRRFAPRNDGNVFIYLLLNGILPMVEKLPVKLMDFFKILLTLLIIMLLFSSKAEGTTFSPVNIR